MKKLNRTLVAVLVLFILSVGNIDTISASTPDYFQPLFSSLEEFLDWIETVDAANYQSGRFESCLLYWRNQGEISVPYFSNPEIYLVQIRIVPFRSPNMMMIHFVHSTPINQIIVRMAQIDPDHIETYEFMGIGAYYSAIWDDFTLSHVAEKTTTVWDASINAVVEHTVSYAFIDYLGAERPLAFSMFILDGLELGVTYRDARCGEHFQNLIWHTIPITDRSYEILQIPPPSPENTMRSAGFIIGSYTYFINGTIPRTTDVAPFIDPAVNRTMIPLRAVAEALLVEVNWLPATQTVQIISQIPEPTVHYLHVGVPLPDNMGIPVIVNDRVFIPLAYAAQLLNARTSWDGRTQTASIARQVYWE